jgi:hypothetical protein
MSSLRIFHRNPLGDEGDHEEMCSPQIPFLHLVHVQILKEDIYVVLLGNLFH